MAEYTGKSGNPSANPNYETPKDTLDTLDLVFHANATRGLLAAVAKLATVP